MAVKLFYKKYPNPSSKQTLVILHGLFGMLDNWHKMATSLSQYMNVISVDQRNHGHSPHTHDMNFELMAQDLKVLLDDLKLEKASILGHSMGGKTAMVFADLYPEYLDRLIVVDIAPKAYKASHEVYFNAFEQIDFSLFERRSEADQALAEHERNKSIRQFLLKNLSRSEKGYRLKFNLAPIRAFYPSMIKELSFHWVISNPCLFIHGGKSAYINEEDKDDILESFSNARFVKIDGAGHWVHAEKPEEFFEAVKVFLVD